MIERRPFALSNRKGKVPVARDLHDHGPLKGLERALMRLRKAKTCDEIIEYVCKDKHRAWNFLPARRNGHGTVELRRSPGVVNA